MSFDSACQSCPLQRICTPLEAIHLFVHVMQVQSMCTWNVRTLLDVDGIVETAKQNDEKERWVSDEVFCNAGGLQYLCWV